MQQSARSSLRLTKQLAFALAVINAALVSVHLFKLRQTMVSGFANGAEILWDMTVPWIRIRITFALILAAIFLLTRRTKGLLGSAASLCWVIAEYTRWLIISRETRLSSGASQIGHPFGIEWWSLVILVITMVLLLLVVRTFIVGNREKRSLG